MQDESGLSMVRRAIKAVGAVVAVPLRLADFILGVPSSAEDSRTVRDLQALAAMHADGKLTAQEYRLAKERLLGNPP